MMLGMSATLFGDDLSRSSCPHIFLDSSSSHCSEDATASSSISDKLCNTNDWKKASTPHIFLSYAKPQQQYEATCNGKNRYSHLLSERRNESIVSSSDLIDLPLYAKSNRVELNRDRHPKLRCFAEDTSQSTQAGQETCEGRPRTQVDWQDLIHAFENQFSRYMIEQHKLSMDHATRVALAMGKAMMETAFDDQIASNSKTDFLTKYTTMLYKSFTPPDGSYMKSRLDLSKDDMCRICRQQEEDLLFLRLALKHMVLQPLVKSSPSPPKEGNLNSMHDPPASLPRESGGGGIPQCIEFCNEPALPDQQVFDSSSELTPSEGDFLLESIPPPRLLSGMQHQP
jgi:hypothetical protein